MFAAQVDPQGFETNGQRSRRSPPTPRTTRVAVTHSFVVTTPEPEATHVVSSTGQLSPDAAAAWAAAHEETIRALQARLRSPQREDERSTAVRIGATFTAAGTSSSLSGARQARLGADAPLIANHAYNLTGVNAASACVRVAAARARARAPRRRRALDGGGDDVGGRRSAPGATPAARPRSSRRRPRSAARFLSGRRPSLTPLPRLRPPLSARARRTARPRRRAQ